jgi:hypothetical protein
MARERDSRGRLSSTYLEGMIRRTIPVTRYVDPSLIARGYFVVETLAVTNAFGDTMPV